MTRLKYSLFSIHWKEAIPPHPLVTICCNWTFLGDPGAISQEETKMSRTKIGTDELDFFIDSSSSPESFRGWLFNVETTSECFNDVITVQTFLQKKNQMRKKKKKKTKNKQPKWKFNDFVRKPHWTSEALLVDNSNSMFSVLINSRIHIIQTWQRTQNWAPNPCGVPSIGRRTHWANLWVDSTQFML